MGIFKEKHRFKAINYVLILTFFISMFTGIPMPKVKAYTGMGPKIELVYGITEGGNPSVKMKGYALETVMASGNIVTGAVSDNYGSVLYNLTDFNYDPGDDSLNALIQTFQGSINPGTYGLNVNINDQTIGNNLPFMVLPMGEPVIQRVFDVIAGMDPPVKMTGINISSVSVSSVSGAVYTGLSDSMAIANLSEFSFNYMEQSVNSVINGSISPGIYYIRLIDTYSGKAFGGSIAYRVKVVEGSSGQLPYVDHVKDVLEPDWTLRLVGQNLNMDPYNSVSGVVYSGTSELFTVSGFVYNYYDGSLSTMIPDLNRSSLQGGSYSLRLFKGNMPFGGQDFYPFSVIYSQSGSYGQPPYVDHVKDVLEPDWTLRLVGKNLNVDTPYSSVSGVVYSGTSELFTVSGFVYNYYDGSLSTMIPDSNRSSLPGGPYSLKLFKGNMPFGGQYSYPFSVIYSQTNNSTSGGSGGGYQGGSVTTYTYGGSRIVYTKPAHGTPGVYKDMDSLRIGFSGLMEEATVTAETVKLLKRLNPGEAPSSSETLMKFSDMPYEGFAAVNLGNRLRTVITEDNRTEIEISNKADSLSPVLEPGRNYILAVKVHSSGVKSVNGQEIDLKGISTGIVRFMDVGDERPAFTGVEFTVAGLNFDPSSMPLAVMGSNLDEPGGVPANLKVLGLGLNKPLDANTVTASTVVLKDTTVAQQVYGSIQYAFDSDTKQAFIYFKPLNDLVQGHQYRLTVKGGISGITGVNGEKLGSDWVRTFTAASAVESTSLNIANVDAYGTAAETRIKVFFKGQVNGIAAGSSNFIIAMSDTLEGTYSPVDLSNARFKFDPSNMAIEIIDAPIIEKKFIKVQFQGLADLFGNIVSVPTPSEPMPVQVKGAEAIQVGGGMYDDFQLKMMDIGAFPINRAGGAATNFIVNVPVNKQIPQGGKVRITFPNGFDISNISKDTMSPKNFDINGPKGTAITISETMDINNFGGTASVTIAGGSTGDSMDADHDFLSFELSGVVNPKFIDGTDNAYNVQITTFDAQGNVLEGPITAKTFYIEKSGEGQVEVTVQDQENNPVSGIKFQLSSPMTGPMKAISGEGGKYSFTGLQKGTYYLFLERDLTGYMPDSMPRVIEITDATLKSYILKVKSMSALGTVRTVTVNVTGGQSGSKVEIFAGAPANFFMQSATLDSNGAASVTLQIPDGGYAFGVRPAPDNTARQWIPPMPQFYQINGDRTVNITMVSSERKISGQVRRSDGAGIAGANVWAYNPTGTSKGAGTTTDSTGRYTLYVPAGIYIVGAMAPGMPPLTEQKVEVGNAVDAAGVDFIARKLDRTITVSVQNSDGVIQKNIPVYAARTDGPGNANGFIGETGSATLFVPPGTYKIGGFVPGFGPIEYSSVDASSSDQTVTIMIQQNATVLVSGRVTGGQNGIKGAGVWAEPSGQGYPGNGTITDDDGYFTLRLTAGTQSNPKNYRLFASSQETGRLTYNNGNPIQVTDSNLTNINFAPQAQGVITINFTRSGNPVNVEALINAYNQQYRNSIYMNGNSAGTTLKVPFNTGTFKVIASVKGAGRLEAETVFADGTATVNFVLPSPVTVTGTVKDQQGTGVENAWVSIMRPDGTFGTGARTGGDGSFNIEIPAYDPVNAERNQYMLTVGHPSYPFRTPEKFSITQGDTVKSFGDITLTSNVLSVTGSVYSNSSGSIDGAFVWAESSDGKWAGTKTDGNGQFTLKLSNGNWAMKVRAEGYELNTSTVAVNGVDVAVGQVTLAAIQGYQPKEQQMNAVKPSTGGTISDTVSGVNITIPANAIGSSSSDYSVVTRETTNVPETSTAKPAGGKGKEIKIQDSTNNQVTTLDNSIQIELSYEDLLAEDSEDTLEDGTPVSSLILGYWDDSTNNWVTIPTTIDTEAKVLKGSTNHLTVFAPIIPAGAGMQTNTDNNLNDNPPVAVPSVPTGLAAGTTTASTINMTWNAVTGATGYKLYRVQGGSDTAVYSGSSTSYQDSGLAAGTTYSYKVSAMNSAGESALSEAVNAATSAAASVEPVGNDGVGGGGTGSTVVVPVETPKGTIQVGDTGKVNAAPTLDSKTGEAAVIIDAATLGKATEKASTDAEGAKLITIAVEKVAGARAYLQELPAAALAASAATQKIQIATEVGTIVVPSNMLAAPDVAGARNVALSIAAVDKAGLDASIKAQIGSRPVIDLNVKVDGKTISWKNADAPVTVSIPYTPTDAEKADLERITIWYIDDSGKIVPVPSGKYDSATGRVVFKTTHFSKYAVAYVTKTFGDITDYAWAKKQIEVMASKGVINGTSADTYTPAAPITRADFMLLLVKSLGLTAKTGDNFDDVASTAYYADAVATARKLGIALGSGSNKFNPQEQISRQDMMTLIARAMKVAKKDLAAGTEADLSKFADKEQIAAYAAESVATLIKNGIVAGDGINVNPLGNATRAETAVLIYRIYNK